MKGWKIKILLICMICFFLSSVAEANAGLADSPWPCFGHDARNTGQSEYKGTEFSTLKWSYDTGAEIRTSPSIGRNGTIYVGSSDNKLYALNHNGSKKWSFETGYRINSSPAVGKNETVYVVARDGTLYALNLDGTLKWTYKVEWGNFQSSPAIGKNGTIYVGADDYKLYALNSNGSLKWTYKTGHRITSTAAVGKDGTIYVGSHDCKLYALNPDGSLKWAYDTVTITQSSPTVGKNGIIYVGSYNGIFALNPDGSLKWKCLEYVNYSSPAIGKNGTIYVGSGLKFYAINPDGSLKWSYDTGDEINSSPAIGKNGTIYVGSKDNKLYAFNPDGSLKWSYETGDSVFSSPSVGIDGTIYVGSYDSKLYAIGLTEDKGGIYGTLSDFSTNETLSNVTVRVSNGKTTQTDENGRFALGELLPGEYDISFSKEGYQGIEKQLEIKEGKSIELNLNLVKSLVGQVREYSSNNTLSNVTVKASNGNTTQTNNNGNYTLGELSPGNYTISFSKDGYQDSEKEVEIQEGNSTNLNATLAKSLVGQVREYSSNNTLSNVTVRASDGNTTQTNNSGNFKLGELKPGNYTINFSKDGYQTLEKEVKIDESKSTNLNATLAKSLVGRITDRSTNDTLSNVTVRAPNGNTTQTDENGRFALGELSPGEYDISFSKEGYQDIEKQLEIKEGKSLELSVNLVKSLIGQVREYSSNNTISNVTVKASNGNTTQTNNSGNYTLGELSPGNYTISFSKDGYQDSEKEVEIQEGNSTNLNATLAKSLVGQVRVYSSNNTLSNVTVKASDGNTTQTNNNGNFVLGDLKPGKYDLTFSKEGYTNTTINNVDIQEGKPTSINTYLSSDEILNIKSSDLPPMELDNSYKPRVQISGGSYPFNFTVSSGQLPPGMSLDKEFGYIKGTPEESGSYSFVVKVEDANGISAKKEFTISVTKPLEFVTDKQLPRGINGKRYTNSLNVEGGKNPYNFKYVDGNLPLNIFIGEDGHFKGKITNKIDFDSMNRLHQSWYTTRGVSHSNRLAIYKHNEASISLNCNSGNISFFQIPNGVTANFIVDGKKLKGWNYADGKSTLSFDIEKGMHTFKWKATSGAYIGKHYLFIDDIKFPAKLTGSYTFSVKVTDAANRTATKEFNLNVDNPLQIKTDKLHNGITGKDFNQTLQASGGYGNYTWNIYSGELPEGLSLNSEKGIIIGQPEETIYDTIVLSARDEDDRVTYKGFNIHTVEPLEIVSDSMPKALQGEEYSEKIRIKGGIEPYNFDYSGQLPEGLSLDKDKGIISGNPTNTESVNVKFSVEDSTYPEKQSDSKRMSIQSSSDLTVLTSAGIPNAKKGEEISPVVLEAGGGPSPYSWKLVNGTMPAGISLDSDTGELSGTPEQRGDFIFNLKVTDADDNSVTKEFFWHVSDQLSVASGALPDGGKDEAYSFSLDADGGLPPYEWQIQSGTLPDGLSLDKDSGTISGTPTNRQSTSFTVEVTDSDSPAQSAEHTYNMEVLDELYIYTKEVANARKGNAYEQKLTAALGKPPYSWSLASGSLPPGVELNSTSKGATLQGTPNQSGSYTFTLEVKDSGTPVQSATREFTMEIYANMEFETKGLASGYNGKSYSDTLEVSGGSVPYNWRITSGSLPSGLYLDSSSGRISGTPNLSAGQSSTFTVKVTDSGDPTGFVEKEFDLYVINPLEITTQDKDIQDAMQGYSYQTSLEGQGGVSPYTWSVFNGELPEGIDLNATSGVIAGTAQEYGDYAFTIRLKDSAPDPNVDTRAYNLQVKMKDEDDDNLPDTWEQEHFDSLNVTDGSDDQDDDGLQDSAEYKNSTDPTEKDTDGDGINDKLEVEHGLDPTDPSDAQADADGDGFSNKEEIEQGTDPRNPEEHPYTREPGDINGDGQITLMDAVLALQMSIGDIEQQGKGYTNADVDGDGKINMTEVSYILEQIIQNK